MKDATASLVENMYREVMDIKAVVDSLEASIMEVKGAVQALEDKVSGPKEGQGNEYDQLHNTLFRLESKLDVLHLITVNLKRVQ